ncbi:sugar phosphate isomerase/epimerase family protein [Croceivirga sp. JEA036]|uniref:sugar phosphate isomerase/epimerase family protein n=1 Tax=Croceivirga sp. JEA036 TaxID=2721162 RepID=UPI00143C97E2|nr:TIM barrel protein [Croceivirga sp. JEA036]NJB35097.1 TIM barrel protein [Croceivirga sp. JEA036]
MQNRRKFIKQTALAAAAVPFSKVFAGPKKMHKSKWYPINFFTKPLDKYDWEFTMDTLKMVGFDGLDSTVRPKGCVLPERVEHDLPKFVEMANKKGLAIEMMVSNITKADDQLAETVLSTAAQNGIKHYRLGYYKYDIGLGVRSSIEKIKDEMVALAEMNKRIGIQGGYQNHAGTWFGASMWDLAQVLDDIPKAWMSNQFDIRHAVCEGNKSWLTSMHLLAENIGSLAIKDFTWDVTGGQSKVKKLPLGEGIVDFDLYFKTLKTLGIVAPITLHVEHELLSTAEEGLSLLKQQKILVSKLKSDVDFIRQKLEEHQLN